MRHLVEQSAAAHGGLRNERHEAAANGPSHERPGWLVAEDTGRAWGGPIGAGEEYEDPAHQDQVKARPSTNFA